MKNYMKPNIEFYHLQPDVIMLSAVENGNTINDNDITFGGDWQV